jgi:hypothetical protein
MKNLPFVAISCQHAQRHRRLLYDRRVVLTPDLPWTLPSP